jgi:hypothetical protein
MAAAVKLDTQQVYQPSQLAQTVWDESRERQSGGWRSPAGAILAALAQFFQPIEGSPPNPLQFSMLEETECETGH